MLHYPKKKNLEDLSKNNKWNNQCYMTWRNTLCTCIITTCYAYTSTPNLCTLQLQIHRLSWYGFVCSSMPITWCFYFLNRIKINFILLFCPSKTPLLAAVKPPLASHLSPLMQCLQLCDTSVKFLVVSISSFVHTLEGRYFRALLRYPLCMKVFPHPRCPLF